MNHNQPAEFWNIPSYTRWNFWDVAFLQNHIDWRDKTVQHQKIDEVDAYDTDHRNEIQGQIELWEWHHCPIEVGEHYVAYVDDKNDWITTWVGGIIAMITRYGFLWNYMRYHNFNQSRRRMVYARDHRGYTYRGVWAVDAQDCIRLKRIT